MMQKLFKLLMELESFDVDAAFRTTDFKFCLTIYTIPIMVPVRWPFLLAKPKPGYIF